MIIKAKISEGVTCMYCVCNVSVLVDVVQSVDVTGVLTSYTRLPYFSLV